MSETPVEQPIIENTTPEVPKEVATEVPVETIETPQPEVKAPETLLGQEKLPDKPAQEETPKDAVVQETEGDKSAEPASLPTYDAFTLPEDIKLDEQRLGEVTKMLGEFENTTKAEHAEVQKLGQSLVDYHVAEIQKTVSHIKEHLEQVRTEEFEGTKNKWKEAFEADPEIGGNRRDTTLHSAMEFINTHGGTPEQQQEFRSLMEETGVGNHPAIIRMLANAMNAMREGSILPGTAPNPTVKNKIQKRYGNL